MTEPYVLIEWADGAPVVRRLTAERFAEECRDLDLAWLHRLMVGPRCEVCAGPLTCGQPGAHYSCRPEDQ